MKPDVIDLEGAIDVHFHPHPDLIPRLTDDRGVVERAREVGMQALVLKCHFESTVGRAYAMDQLFDGIRVFGGIVLNHCHGGINPDCVEASVRLGAKEIWMPTVDADHHVEVYGRTGGYDVQKGGKERKEGVRAVVDGRLTREVHDVLDILAKGDAILCTGHLHRDHVEMLVRAAIDRGVKKIILQHPFFKIPHMPLTQLKALTDLGALAEIEYCGISPMWQWEGQTLRGMRQAVAELSARHFILISDAGQRHNPLPPDALRILAQGLYELGVTREELRMMMVENPARLLGL